MSELVKAKKYEQGAMVRTDDGTRMTDHHNIDTTALGNSLFAAGLKLLDKEFEALLPSKELPGAVKHSAITYTEDFSEGLRIVNEAREAISDMLYGLANPIENPRELESAPLPDSTLLSRGVGRLAGAASGIAVSISSVKPDNWGDGIGPNLVVFDQRKTAGIIPAVPAS